MMTLLSGDERRGGDGVGLGWVGGLDAPYAGSGALVERDESPVERAFIDFAVVDGYAAVDHIATEKIGSLAGNLRIVVHFICPVLASKANTMFQAPVV